MTHTRRQLLTSTILSPAIVPLWFSWALAEENNGGEPHTSGDASDRATDTSGETDHDARSYPGGDSAGSRNTNSDQMGLSCRAPSVSDLIMNVLQLEGTGSTLAPGYLSVDPYSYSDDRTLSAFQENSSSFVESAIRVLEASFSVVGPWVGLRSVGIIEGLDWNAGGYFRLEITNAGKSPAINVSVTLLNWNTDINVLKFPINKCTSECRVENLQLVPGTIFGMIIPRSATSPLPKGGDTGYIIERVEERMAEVSMAGVPPTLSAARQSVSRRGTMPLARITSHIGLLYPRFPNHCSYMQ